MVALFRACVNGDTEEAESQLSQGANSNIRATRLAAAGRREHVRCLDVCHSSQRPRQQHGLQRKNGAV